MVVNEQLFVGIDNGVSGSIGIITPDGSNSWFFKTPVKKEQDYTKKKKNVSRLEVTGFITIFEEVGISESDWSEGKLLFPKFIAGLERPMVNPKRWSASLSAMRCWEAQQIAMETLGCFRREPIDSKEWQRVLLPKGIKGAPLLKKASLDIGLRLFPEHTDRIIKQKDADGILIAEFMRRKLQGQL